MPSCLLDRSHWQLPGIEQENRQDEDEHLDTTPRGYTSAGYAPSAIGPALMHVAGGPGGMR